MQLTLINLTPHPVVMYAGDGPVASWAPSGVVARLVERVGPVCRLVTDQGEVAMADMSYAEGIEGLPEAGEGTAYIVSRVLAAAVVRDDLYFPLDEVRDDEGRIAGCRALGKFIHEEARDDAG